MKKMRRIAGITLSVIMMISALAGCGEKKEETSSGDAGTSEGTEAAGNAEGTVKIALYGPLTGNNAQYGLTYQATLNALCEKVNSEGGINGRNVEVVVYDDKNDPKEALNVANLIVSDPEVVAVIGSQTSSPTLAAAPVFEEAGIPMITPQASHVDITPTGDHIFSISCLATFEGGVIAQRMIADGYKKVAAIYANDDYGLNIIERWKTDVTEAGLEIVDVEEYISGQTSDFTPLLSKIKEAGAEAVYIVPSYADTAMICTQMGQLDMDIQKYACSMCYTDAFLEAAGEASEGTKVCNFIYPETTDETFIALKKLLNEKTDMENIDVYATNSHDAFMLLVDAMKEVGTDGDAIVKWLSNVKDWPGACGPITFDETRHPEKQLFWFQVEDGAFTYIGQ
ncbi:ABC transporter substrate-binding protein [Lacrimispora sp. NSJ-141]|uniref:ABC transporter substrate-binding protein n=1 Tax=Lientehia hominis TaxID=2897778 RepID=A0AAP2WAE4_9FIRM|nr:ABC transporter substrate-binding protein [Lientehia hominis]MCD2493227.1 ABC transporter substrate-binding protein [Lientehia hominis]